MKEIRKQYKEEVKKQLKTNHIFEDMKYHFKNFKWPLNYHYYFNESKLNNELLFNLCVEALKCKIYYDEDRLMLMIRKTVRKKS